MIVLNSKQSFQALFDYIEADSKIDTNSWEVRDLLSLADTNPKITIHSGGPTADPAVWQDWKEIIKKILDDKQYSNIKSSDNYQLTREQALKAMSYFLNDRYWKKNPDMLLIDAVADLRSIIEKGNLENTEIWTDWLSCVERSLSFTDVFE